MQTKYVARAGLVTCWAGVALQLSSIAFGSRALSDVAMYFVGIGMSVGFVGALIYLVRGKEF